MTNIIKINRGDSFEFDLFISDKLTNSRAHILKANEAVYFALLYPHQKFEDAILIKGYNFEDQDSKTACINIKITPNDTRTLAPGVYYYTVKFQRGGTLEAVGDMDEPEEVRTIIERTKFIINE